MSQHHKSTPRMLELKAEFRALCEATNAHCWMCGFPIDYTIPPELSWRDGAFQLDHHFPVSTHPLLAEDRGNFRASHSECNRDRGDGDPHPPLGILSEAWF